MSEDRVRIIVVEDEPELELRWRKFFTYRLTGVDVRYAPSYDAVLAFVEDEHFYPDIAIIDHRLLESETQPGAGGIEVAKRLARFMDVSNMLVTTVYDMDRLPDTERLLYSEYDRMGIKTVRKDSDFIHELQSYLGDLVDKIQNGSPLQKRIASSSEKMRVLLTKAELHITTARPLLLQGETGCGRKHLAQNIHALRNEIMEHSGTLETINCAEFLSHEKLHSALFDALDANQGGTLVITAIETLPSAYQIKLASRLKLMSSTENGAPVLKVIAISDEDSKGQDNAGSFRQELHSKFALLGFPPLRERREDIIPLATRYLNRCYEGFSLSPSAEHKLESHMWTGNIEELFDAIDLAVSESGNHKQLTSHLFKLDSSDTQPPSEMVCESSSQIAYEAVSKESKKYIVATFSNSSKTFQVDDHLPVELNSWRHYAILRANVKLSEPEEACDPSDFDRALEKAKELELELTPQHVQESKNWKPISDKIDITDVNNKFRRWMRTKQLAFLEPLVPKRNAVTVDYSRLVIREGTINNGVSISQFHKLPI